MNIGKQMRHVVLLCNTYLQMLEC